jgi:TonB family protein
MKTCPVCDTPFPDQHNTCPTDGAVLLQSPELIPGHIVRGKYRIVRKLGQGGMGTVYLAEHLLLGGQVALKFLAAELNRNPQFVKRFRNEARVAYQLRHPNIVEVTDLDQEEDGSLFIAMEFVAGPNLRAVLRETKGPLPVVRALQIAGGVAAGLAAAHERGAVHRDIKPENILLGLLPSGRVQPKVLDFGIVAMTESITDLSRTHGLLLTPEYAAPEQWRGTPANELDGRTDLYAVGCVIYEMLTGRTPFRAVNPEGWMFQHLQGVPEPLGKLRPDLEKEHPGLDAVVMRLLAREREQRFPSATAFLESLTPPVPAPAPAVTPPPTPQREIPSPRTIVEPKPAKPHTSAGSLFLQWTVWAVAIVLLVGLVSWLLLAWYFRPQALTAVPILNPVGGAYLNPQPVTISDGTPEATIHYTVDGTTPTEASPVYTHALSALPSGTVVRAMASAEGSKPSADVSGVYTWLSAAKPPPLTSPQESATQPNPAAQESPYDAGKSAYDRKQYGQARTLFSQACDGGEMRACNYLGYLYAQGLGGAPNQEKARILYQSACDGGNLSSCASLGSLYQDGGNNGEARKYFKKACDGGLAEGCSLLHDIGAKANSQLPSTGNTNSPVGDNNRARLADLRRQLSDLSLTLTPQNPKMQQLKAQIADLEQQSAQHRNDVITPRTSTGAPITKLSISSGVMAKMLVEKTIPQYPAIAKAARIQGTVVLEATISKTGLMQHLRVISGPPMLQQAALDAVRSWRYKPYRLNGDPVEVETTVNVVFNLGG